MSKKFKNKTCVYCAVKGASETGDHVFAREFLPVAHRTENPQVPSCKACNKEKSDLEHYLTAVLPFGGRHADAFENLTCNVPKRLAKNLKLHRELAKNTARIWVKEKSGLLVRSMTIPIDGEKTQRLVSLMIKGLMWHHWSVLLDTECFVEAYSLTERGEQFFQQYSRMKANRRVENNIGEGAFVYSGAQGVDNPRVSIWEFSIYGGLKMADANKRNIASKFGVMTGPKTVLDRAEEQMKCRISGFT